MNSSNIKHLSDSQLIERVTYLVRRERELVECLIWHLQEIQDRKLYIQMGFTSLFECLVRHFKYSEAVAYSRISALKILTAVPEAAEALNSGEVNLTTLSLTQSLIRKQEKETGEKVSAEQKIQYLQAVKNKSTQEVKQILATISPVSELPIDKVLYLDKDHAQLQVTVCKALLEKIEKLKAHISHENINPSYNEVLHLALDAALEKIERKKGLHGGKQIETNTNKRARTNGKMNPDTNKNAKENIEPNENAEANAEENAEANAEENANADVDGTKARTPKTSRHEHIENKSNGDVESSNANITSTRSFSIKSSEKRSRYIRREVKRMVLKRSRNQCEHINADGSRCQSHFQMQFDHIIAVSKNGGSEFNNIQHLCRVHNDYKGAK